MPSASTNPAVHSNYYEGPSAQPGGDELWCYSDQLCYSPVDTVAFHVSTTASSYSIEIARDSVELEILRKQHSVAAAEKALEEATPEDADA